MADQLRDQLQTSLRSAYTIGRELGGGGISRVFVAEDTTLGRSVVVKVRAPELTAGVNVDRFKREIRVAARLQHPPEEMPPLVSASRKYPMEHARLGDSSHWWESPPPACSWVDQA